MPKLIKKNVKILFFKQYFLGQGVFYAILKEITEN